MSSSVGVLFQSRLLHTNFFKSCSIFVPKSYAGRFPGFSKEPEEEKVKRNKQENKAYEDSLLFDFRKGNKDM
jgi:hypothetical protein